jgi:hypothetical protein
MMALTKQQESCTDFRILPLETISPTAFPQQDQGDCLSAVPSDPMNYGILNQFIEQIPREGIDISAEEFNEILILDEFLSGHVMENRTCDVQCMLLWSEWVRTFRRNIPGFPNIIREKEFRSLITDMYDVGIGDDGFRGDVYPGLRFVP